MSARLMGADRIIAIDCVEDRLEMARAQGAEIIDFSQDDPVEAIRELTGGIGPDRVIDAVGIDAIKPPDGKTPAPKLWQPGDGPGQVLEWAVNCVAKAGTIGIIGVYPPTAREFPIGAAMNKNLTIKAGNCNHRRYVPHLVDMVRNGTVDPLSILTKSEPLLSALDAYEKFDQRGSGWLKVRLDPAA